jgi:hypothetical protein
MFNFRELIPRHKLNIRSHVSIHSISDASNSNLSKSKVLPNGRSCSVEFFMEVRNCFVLSLSCCHLRRHREKPTSRVWWGNSHSCALKLADPPEFLNETCFFRENIVKCIKSEESEEPLLPAEKCSFTALLLIGMTAQSAGNNETPFLFVWDNNTTCSEAVVYPQTQTLFDFTLFKKYSVCRRRFFWVMDGAMGGSALVLLRGCAGPDDVMRTDGRFRRSPIKAVVRWRGMCE